MKIAVICANGKAGQKITAEALKRNHDVTAFVRGENKSKAEQVVTKDIFAVTPEDLAGFDSVIDCFGAWTEETLSLHEKSLMHLADCVAGGKTRLYVVGGAGSLYLDKEHTKTVTDLPEFPDMFKPLALAMAKALAKLRTRKDVAWVYLSPACDFQAEGEATGEYALAGEELQVNAKGESHISYADYAAAMLDVAEQGEKYSQKRISVFAK